MRVLDPRSPELVCESLPDRRDFLWTVTAALPALVLGSCGGGAREATQTHRPNLLNDLDGLTRFLERDLSRDFGAPSLTVLTRALGSTGRMVLVPIEDHSVTAHERHRSTSIALYRSLGIRLVGAEGIEGERLTPTMIETSFKQAQEQSARDPNYTVQMEMTEALAANRQPRRVTDFRSFLELAPLYRLAHDQSEIIVTGLETRETATDSAIIGGIVSHVRSAHALLAKGNETVPLDQAFQNLCTQMEALTRYLGRELAEKMPAIGRDVLTAPKLDDHSTYKTLCELQLEYVFYKRDKLFSSTALERLQRFRDGAMLAVIGRTHLDSGLLSRLNERGLGYVVFEYSA